VSVRRLDVDPAMVASAIDKGHHMLRIRVLRVFGRDLIFLLETERPRLTDPKTGTMRLRGDL
jgi:hypothetical protein